MSGTTNDSIEFQNDSIHICSICLDPITNEKRCIAKYCMHQFCHDCLQQWLNNNNSCPLCKVQIQSVMYNLKSDFDYEERFVDYKSPANKTQDETPPYYEDDEYDNDRSASFDLTDISLMEVVSYGITEDFDIITFNNSSCEDGSESGNNTVTEYPETNSDQSVQSKSTVSDKDSSGSIRDFDFDF